MLKEENIKELELSYNYMYNHRLLILIEQTALLT